MGEAWEVLAEGYSSQQDLAKCIFLHSSSIRCWTPHQKTPGLRTGLPSWRALNRGNGTCGRHGRGVLHQKTRRWTGLPATPPPSKDLDANPFLQELGSAGWQEKVGMLAESIGAGGHPHRTRIREEKVTNQKGKPKRMGNTEFPRVWN